MINMKSLSICLSAHNRHELLERTIHSWQQQEDPDFEVVMIDDASEPPIESWLAEKGLDGRLDLRVIRSDVPHGSHTWGYNECLAAARGTVLLFTHPEIMLPPSIVGIAKARVKPQVFLTFKPLWVTPLAQTRIDDVDWRLDCRLLKNIKEVYINRAYPLELMRSWNQDQETRVDWESTTTFAMLREDLLAINGFNEFDQWGPDDPDFETRRGKLGITTVVVREELVLHQWHGPMALNCSQTVDRLRRFWLENPEIRDDARKTNSHIDFQEMGA